MKSGNDSVDGKLGLQMRRNVIKGLALAGIAGAGILSSKTAQVSADRKNPTFAFFPRVEQWGIEEVALRSERAYENPFDEVELQATVTSGQTAIPIEQLLKRHSMFGLSAYLCA